MFLGSFFKNLQSFRVFLWPLIAAGLLSCAQPITEDQIAREPERIPLLIAAINEKNVPFSACYTLGIFGGRAKQAIPRLIDLYADQNQDKWVRRYSASSIQKILEPDEYPTKLINIAKILKNDNDEQIRTQSHNIITKYQLASVAKGQQQDKSDNSFFEDSTPKQTDVALNIKIIKRSLSTDQNAIAVIIGNRNYSTQKQNVPDVNFAHNDADLMKRYVIEGIGYREGNVIDLRDATQANLTSVFGNKDNPRGQLYGWLRPGESDVFIYYSGHGAPGLSNGQGYLLPVDANPNTVELNGYPLETLYANLGQLPAKSLTVVIDACFSGSSQAGSVVKNASAISLKRVDAKATLPNATILTAAGVSEVASWDEEAKLGLFTRHFLEGVTGKADQGSFGNVDGQVTLGELKNYLESEVTYMARRLYMREQHPQVSGEMQRLF